MQSNAIHSQKDPPVLMSLSIAKNYNIPVRHAEYAVRIPEIVDKQRRVAQSFWVDVQNIASAGCVATYPEEHFTENNILSKSMMLELALCCFRYNLDSVPDIITASTVRNNRKFTPLFVTGLARTGSSTMVDAFL